ncbi:DUS3-like protein [Mya arenaria]|uniref:Dual specificity protein phosphatase n=1 Tax=Mya arenaria TaxID=6604 RepID=A0ABY7EN33_MYAAR|nr:DUS3-like protein [Mya arenaria]
MTYSQKLYHRVREYLITSTDDRLHGDNSSSGAAPTFWMFTLPQAPSNSYDEVYPGIFMGDMQLVRDKAHLKELGITHMVNCSQGKGPRETDTDARFYRDAGIKFHGMKAVDSPTFNMMPFFKAAVDFIDKALKSDGVSRSATIVIAYLMLKCNMNILEAVRAVRPKRKIHPNDGFIRQLCFLNRDLYGGDD